MVTPFRIEEAREDDIPEIMSMLIPSFEHVPLEPLMGNVNTPDGLKAAGERHLRAWREHASDSSITPCAIKCVHTDPSTGKDSIIGFAEWFIYDRPRSKEQYSKENFLVSASWLPEKDGQQAKIKGMLRPMVEGRKKWMGGRAHGMFMYMAVDKAWRRQGASTMCVQWGLNKCKELGIPAYLEASEEGEPVYKKQGFVEVEKVKIMMGDIEGAFPAMIWWPPGTKEEDKKPAVG